MAKVVCCLRVTLPSRRRASRTVRSIARKADLQFELQERVAIRMAGGLWKARALELRPGARKLPRRWVSSAEVHEQLCAESAEASAPSEIADSAGRALDRSHDGCRAKARRPLQQVAREPGVRAEQEVDRDSSSRQRGERPVRDGAVSTVAPGHSRCPAPHLRTTRAGYPRAGVDAARADIPAGLLLEPRWGERVGAGNDQDDSRAAGG